MYTAFVCWGMVPPPCRLFDRTVPPWCKLFDVNQDIFKASLELLVSTNSNSVLLKGIFIFNEASQPRITCHRLKTKSHSQNKLETSSTFGGISV